MLRIKRETLEEAVDKTTQLVEALGEKIQNVTTTIAAMTSEAVTVSEAEGEKRNFKSVQVTLKVFLDVSETVEESTFGNFTETVTQVIAKAGTSDKEGSLIVGVAIFFALLMCLGVVVIYVRWFIADQKYARKMPVYDDNDVELVPMQNTVVPASATEGNQ